MDQKQKQELFLPIHGHVELYADELAIIDHPAFQRLRRVRQLGLAHMVFPGATHTRFEHSVGAVHVAKLIVDHVNENHSKNHESRSWKTTEINEATARFIRLAALLHDVGHLPFGHTLEDELNHLQSHDRPDRLERVARIPYPSHEVNQALVPLAERPEGGWTLKALINRLYKRHTEKLEIADIDAFTILSHIVCKPPKEEGPEKEAWKNKAKDLSNLLSLGICQDIVGNTICADFLDYLYRDWYHLGKPLYYDQRLFQYMEVRQPVDAGNGDRHQRFVINVGASEKIRHDALTDILELLNARYKLAETVLFHRTKLALTGLLDRCLLEIADLYVQVGLGVQDFKVAAEKLLLDASDDGLPLILKELAVGGDIGKRLRKAKGEEERAIKKEVADPQASLIEEPAARGKLGKQEELVFRVIDKLRDREVYTLAHKLRIADFPGTHSPENRRLRKLLDNYKEPQNRLDYLRKMEALCQFEAGTLVMNCPPDPTMNAKIAKVNLLIEDEVSAFDDYEKQHGEAGLTHRALLAQIGRFYELWAASVYVDSRRWRLLSEEDREHLKSVLGEFFFRMDDRKAPKVSRAQLQPSLDVLRNKASRTAAPDPAEELYRGSDFPSGMPFDNPNGK